MITLRRAEERCTDPLPDGFAPLVSVREARLPPGAWMPRPSPGDTEVVTYVREGVLAFDDTTGRSGVVLAGEFHRSTGRHGVRRNERNPSRTEVAHVLRVALGCADAGARHPEQRRFSAAERRGVLCVVASPDARGGSLRLAEDALVCSALLEPGQHVVHALPRGRSAWLHVVEGEATLGDLVVCAGDGVGVTTERSVSLTAREPTEILLLELGARRRRRGDPE